MLARIRIIGHLSFDIFHLSFEEAGQIIGHISFDIFHLSFFKTRTQALENVTYTPGGAGFEMAYDKCQMIYDQ